MQILRRIKFEIKSFETEKQLKSACLYTFKLEGFAKLFILYFSWRCLALKNQTFEFPTRVGFEDVKKQVWAKEM